uniref:Vesicle transport protein n=1 Tax=Opuntia streptacantha TaxID=393608 RepID=A0A7C9DSY8_OPUST
MMKEEMTSSTNKILIPFALLSLLLSHSLSSLNPSNLPFYSLLGMSWLLEAFVIGPAEQLRKMFDPVRVYATAVYLACVVLALVCAILIHSKILTLLAMICEICALIWYSLSYIPFARRLVSDMMVRLFDTEI